MLKTRLTLSSLVAAAGLAMASVDIAPTKGSHTYHRPKRQPRLDTETAREIAEHNAAIDAKNAERKARRAKR